MKIDDLVILVDGKSTSQERKKNRTPKSLIKIDNKPFLKYILSKLQKYNFKKIYLICPYKDKKFFRLFHKTKVHNTKVICIYEGDQKSILSCLYLLRNKIKKNFILINGDTFFDIDFNKIIYDDLGNNIIKMCLAHKNKALSNNDFTNLHLNNFNKIFFSNKKSSTVNGGVYLISRFFFKYMKNKKLPLESDVISNLINQNKVLGEYFDNKFIDIGSQKNINFIKKNVNILKNKCLFLDRDGVINKHSGYILDYKKFKFLPGVKKGIKYANKKNYLVIIITNQSAVGRSWISEKKLNNIHDKMKKELFSYNKSCIDDIFFSPYYKNSIHKKYRINKNDRKPGIGMVKKAIKKWNIDNKSSIFIGDQITDKQVSLKSGIRFFFKKDCSFYKQIKQLI